MKCDTSIQWIFNENLFSLFHVEELSMWKGPASSSYLLGHSPWVTSSCEKISALLLSVKLRWCTGCSREKLTSLLPKDNRAVDFLKICWLYMHFNILQSYALNCAQGLCWMMGLKRVFHVPWIVYKVLSRGTNLFWNVNRKNYHAGPIHKHLEAREIVNKLIMLIITICVITKAIAR